MYKNYKKHRTNIGSRLIFSSAIITCFFSVAIHHPPFLIRASFNRYIASSLRNNVNSLKLIRFCPDFDILSKMLTTFLWLVSILLLLIFVVRWYVNRNDNYWPDQGVKLLKLNDVEGFVKRWTFQINMTDFHRKIYNMFKNEGVQDGGGYMEFTTPVYYPMNLDVLRLVLVKDFDFFPDRRVMDLKNVDPIFARMMTNLTGQEWKDLRSTMSPTFTTGKIRRMFRHFNSCGQHLADYLKEKEIQAKAQGLDNVVDFQDAFGRYTMDAISSIAFGLDTDVFTNDKSLFREMVKKFQTFTPLRLLKFLAIMIFPILGRVFRAAFADKAALKFFTTVAKTNMDQRRKVGGLGERGDFLDIMLEAASGQLKVDSDDVVMDNYEKDAILQSSPTQSSSNGSNVTGIGKKPVLDDDTILAQCLLFFSAGSDTMETVLTFTAYALALHPEIQEKLAEEIGVAMEENDGTLTYEAIHKMEYLDMVLSETLRLYPPAFATERTAIRKYEIPGTKISIPKGGRVAIPITGIHHDPDYYPDPERFDPERFTAENKAKRHPYAYLPFGQGPRNCIAMRFALTEAKSAIAHLVHNFRIEPSEQTQIPIKYSSKNFIIKPENGMPLKFSGRQSS